MALIRVGKATESGILANMGDYVFVTDGTNPAALKFGTNGETANNGQNDRFDMIINAKGSTSAVCTRGSYYYQVTNGASSARAVFNANTPTAINCDYLIVYEAPGSNVSVGVTLS